MAGLKDIKSRIVSVTSTRQITSAMKLISAAKLKKAQDAIIQIRPYANKLRDVLAEVSSVLPEKHSNIYGQIRDPKNILIVLLASNRGLCGAFNSNACKKSIQHIEEKYPNQLAAGNIKFFCIGKKANEYIKKFNFEIIKSIDEIYDDLVFASVSKYAEEMMNMFVEEKFDRIDIVYNSFKNASVQEQKVDTYLPMTIEEKEKKPNIEYIFEPSVEKIVDEMLPKSLKIQFHKILLDSFAAEQGARMTAMHQATDNATELIRDLTLMYNKARQASITNEILEITSGAEALNG
jgi:F-type H+-transporting ATPase subunit gamma